MYQYIVKSNTVKNLNKIQVKHKITPATILHRNINPLSHKHSAAAQQVVPAAILQTCALHVSLPKRCSYAS